MEKSNVLEFIRKIWQIWQIWRYDNFGRCGPMWSKLRLFNMGWGCSAKPREAGAVGWNAFGFQIAAAFGATRGLLLVVCWWWCFPSPFSLFWIVQCRTFRGQQKSIRPLKAPSWGNPALSLDFTRNCRPAGMDWLSQRPDTSSRKPWDKMSTWLEHAWNSFCCFRLLSLPALPADYQWFFTDLQTPWGQERGAHTGMDVLQQQMAEIHSVLEGKDWTFEARTWWHFMHEIRSVHVEKYMDSMDSLWPGKKLTLCYADMHGKHGKHGKVQTLKCSTNVWTNVWLRRLVRESKLTTSFSRRLVGQVWWTKDQAKETIRWIIIWCYLILFGYAAVSFHELPWVNRWVPKDIKRP